MKKKYIIPAAVGVSLAALSAALPAIVFSLSSVTDSRLYRQPKRKGADGEALDAFLASYRERMAALDLPLIEMTSFDGLKLYAHWYPCENARRTIVLVHGWHSFWDVDFAGVTDYLHDGGANLLFIEQRAQGMSEGKSLPLGILERFDVLDWVKKLPEFSDPALPVYLFGVSMGASTVLMASGLDVPDSVCGIVADCGFTSPSEIIRLVSGKRAPLPAAFIEKGAGLHLRLRTGFDYSACSALDAVRNSHTPTLFVHGGADSFVPCSMSCRNYLACAAPKSILIVPGAGHALSFLFDPDRYKRAVEKLFSECEDSARA